MAFNCEIHGTILYGKCGDCEKLNKEAEAKGRENYYASYELADNPYQKNSRQFLAWAYGYIDAREQ